MVKTVVSIPARTAYSAAETPAGPEPMITMFGIFVSFRLNDLELSPLHSDNIRGNIIFIFANQENLRIFLIGFSREGS